MKKIIVRRKNIDEGISDYLPSADSVYAFGRNAADTVTLGGYKYGRGFVDYGVKNTMKALGLRKKGTTLKREIDQEKEKLAKDDIKSPKASAAGDIAGYAALAVTPEIPAVGKTLGSAIGAGEKASKVPYYFGLARKAVGLEENLAGAGASMDGMSAPFSAVGQEIEAKRKQKPIPLGKTMGSYVDEDAPANAAGGGNVAAIGVGPQGEPGRKAIMQPMARRGKFMTYETFIVSSATFNSLREAKKRGKHWRTYLNEDEAYHDLREYAKKCKGPIIIEDERTGACMYVRYGKQGLHEAWTNKVGRGGSRWLSSAGENIKGLEVLRGAKKIGNYNKTHSVYTHTGYTDDGPSRHYHLVHNETGHITHSVNGPMNKGVLTVSGAGASEENKKLGTKIKMEDFYHHLLKRGAHHEASGSKEPNQHPVALVGTSHSGPSEDEEGDYGAQKVWRNLAKKYRTSVHGFFGGKKGKGVNIGKAEDPTETHADPHEYHDWTGEPSKGSDREATEVGRMKLVASVEVPKVPKKKKFRYKIRRRGR